MARLELLPAPESVATGRRWVRAQVDDDVDDLGDRLQLLVSELLTNVVVHARTVCELVVRRGENRIRVEVVDSSDDLPARARDDLMAPSGRGLMLVDALSDAHGVDLLPQGGKRVWFELCVTG